MTDKIVTIVLADDHTIVRQGLVKLLEAEPNFRVVGEAENGRQAVDKVEKLSPNIVLMDIQTRVIILSMHSHNRYINELFSLGASGYLLKNSTGSDIINAIHAALKGDHYLSPSISKRVIQDYISMKKKSATDDLYGQLSNREREVFQMIAEGRSTKEISDILFISPSTVKTHRVKIMEKLQVENISQLIQFAIRVGIVDIQM